MIGSGGSDRVGWEQLDGSEALRWGDDEIVGIDVSQWGILEG